MKILFAVHFVKLPHGCGNILVKAWDNFLKHHKKDLQCDVVFMSGHHSTGELQELAPHCDRCYRPEEFERACESNTAKFGVALNYPTVADAEDYDFVFRMDYDAFTTVSSINNICAFIRNNPEVDFISPTNAPRNLTMHDEAMKLFVEKKEINGREWYSFFPFGYQTNNGDLFGIRREFFMELCSRLGDVENSHTWPYLIRNTFTYQDVCNTLGIECPLTDKGVRSSIVYVDGLFGSDAWTHFCSMKPVAAGILDQRTKISFVVKNILRNCGHAMQFPTFDEIVDPSDRSFPYKKNAMIDHIFHMESTYMMSVYWNSIIDNKVNDAGGFLGAFYPTGGSYTWAHYSIIKLLTEQFGDKELNQRLEYSMNRLFRRCGTHVDELEAFAQKVKAFYYEQAMKEYIQ